MSCQTLSTVYLARQDGRARSPRSIECCTHCGSDCGGWFDVYWVVFAKQQASRVADGYEGDVRDQLGKGLSECLHKQRLQARVSS